MNISRSLDYPPRHLWIKALQADQTALSSFLGFLWDLEVSAVGKLKVKDSELERARMQIVDELRQFAVLTISPPDRPGVSY